MLLRNHLPLYFSLFMLWANQMEAQVAEYSWVKQIGDSGCEHGAFMTTDHTGNIIIVGVDCLLKLDMNGKIAWSTSIGENQYYLWPEAVAADLSDNVIIALKNTVTLNEIYLVKYDSTGQQLWFKLAISGKLGVHVNDLAFDDSYNLIMTGSLSDTTKFDSDRLVATGFTDFYIAKYQSDGKLIWIKQAGGNRTFTVGRQLIIDKEMNYIVAGDIDGKAIFESDTLANDSRDIFLAKYNSESNLLWVKRINGTKYDRPSGLAIDNFNNIVLSGWFHGSIDFGAQTLVSRSRSDKFISEFSQAGHFRWVKQFDADDFTISTIAVDSQGNIYASGWFSGQIDIYGKKLASRGESDIFFAGFDNNGHVNWVKQAGGNNYDYGLSLAINSMDEAILIGTFSDTSFFDSTQLISQGNQDLFVAKLGKNITNIRESAIKHSIDFSLSQNYPNPFNPLTKIRYTVPEKAFVSLKIINVRGQEVRKLVDSKKELGTYVAIWNGQDKNSKPVPSGVYYYTISIGLQRFTKKMIVLR